jgi:hypothetical protein
VVTSGLLNRRIAGPRCARPRVTLQQWRRPTSPVVHQRRLGCPKPQTWKRGGTLCTQLPVLTAWGAPRLHLRRRRNLDPHAALVETTLLSRCSSRPCKGTEVAMSSRRWRISRAQIHSSTPPRSAMEKCIGVVGPTGRRRNHQLLCQGQRCRLSPPQSRQPRLPKRMMMLLLKTNPTRSEEGKDGRATAATSITAATAAARPTRRGGQRARHRATTPALPAPRRNLVPEAIAARRNLL